MSGQGIDLSVNEFQAMVHKAARGSGLAVGLADALVDAVSALAADYPLDAAVVEGLNAADRASQMGQIGPALVTSSRFITLVDAPCFFELAAASDRQMRGMMANAGAALLVIGYAKSAAQAYGLTGRIQFANGTVARFDASSVSVKGDIPHGPADLLIVCGHGERVRPARVAPFRIRAHPEHWRRLNQLAAKTYVPATGASRIKGAGEGTVAGLTEYD